MQSISPIHPNRPALLRCYINRATLPSTSPRLPWAPQRQEIDVNKEFCPTFPSTSSRPTLKNTSTSTEGPSEPLTVPLSPLQPPLTPQSRSARNTPGSLKWHHKEGAAQKTALAKYTYTCGGSEPPLSVNRVAAVRRGSTRRRQDFKHHRCWNSNYSWVQWHSDASLRWGLDGFEDTWTESSSSTFFTSKVKKAKKLVLKNIKPKAKIKKY